ncbi:hypothetical protein N7456_008105 [Penicillium angulare]|uniref:Uncharacterized protein n=1 Tax=Penicillium angulare TaxID=116970 RepID=A0A9W9FC77_9EURO|nr:hypothetical protein N7456_008105 [Penicillium angulare]
MAISRRYLELVDDTVDSLLAALTSLEEKIGRAKRDIFFCSRNFTVSLVYLRGAYEIDETVAPIVATKMISNKICWSLFYTTLLAAAMKKADKNRH